MKEESVKRLMQARDLIIPGYLLNNMKKLGLTYSELVFLSIIINERSDYLFDAVYLSDRLNISVPEVMKIVSSLTDKKLIELKLETRDNKQAEIINIDTIYTILLLNDTKEDDKDHSRIYETIEKELGRTLSPIEYETIGEWINNGVSEELINAALKEAVLSGVTNLKYIDKIIHDWSKKGYKKLRDIKKKSSNRKQEDIFEYDWLDHD